MELRWYQKELNAGVERSRAQGARNVMVCAPTGSGKTVMEAYEINKELIDTGGPILIMAHAAELVSQIAQTVAGFGIRHRIIGPPALVRECVSSQLLRYGRSFVDPRAAVSVAGVDTLMARSESYAAFLKTIKLWIVDEAHHVQRENKWGKVCEMMTGARGLMYTATPERADGGGLGRHADGLADDLVVGPTGEDLIDDGYLSPYKIFGMDSIGRAAVDALKVGKTGDFSAPQVRKLVRETPKIVGDIVDHYLNHVKNGSPGITFTTDIQEAEAQAAEFNARGVKCAALSGKTPSGVRNHILNEYRLGRYSQLVNVNLFGEGFDLPALVGVSMGCPTQSFARYSQWFGRMLRCIYADGAPTDTAEQRKQAMADGPKPYGILLDHCSNVIRHNGPPTRSRVWTLDRRRSAKSTVGEIPLTYCLGCTQPFEKFHVKCPHCGHYEEPTPLERRSPDKVAGDLVELTPEVLARLLGDVETADATREEVFDRFIGQGLPDRFAHSNAKIHEADKEARGALRAVMSQWAGFRGDSDMRHTQREFYYKFGVDVLTAQTLKKNDSFSLAKKIELDYFSKS